jgi:hypothetical protein
VFCRGIMWKPEECPADMQAFCKRRIAFLMSMEKGQEAVRLEPRRLPHKAPVMYIKFDSHVHDHRLVSSHKDKVYRVRRIVPWLAMVRLFTGSYR